MYETTAMETEPTLMESINKFFEDIMGTTAVLEAINEMEIVEGTNISKMSVKNPKGL